MSPIIWYRTTVNPNPQVLDAGFTDFLYISISGVRMLGFIVVAAAVILYAVLTVAERLSPLAQAPDLSPPTQQRGRTIDGSAVEAGDDMNFPLIDAKVQSTASRREEKDPAAYTAERGWQQP